MFAKIKVTASRWLTGRDAFKGVASTLRFGKCKQLAWPLSSHHQEGSGPDNGTPFQLMLKVLFIPLWLWNQKSEDCTSIPSHSSFLLFV